MRQNGSIIRWTTPTGNKFFWSPEIVEMLAFMLHTPQAQRLTIIAEIAAYVMECSRCCIILQKDGGKHRDKKLVLTAGYPNNGTAHGFGLEITPATGKTFLTKIIKEGNVVIIPDSPDDRRVAYMKDSILHHGIKKQLLVPLFLKRLEVGFEIDPFGVLVFDSTEENQEAFENTVATAKKIAKVAVTLIISEERRQKMDYELARIACANILAEHAKGFEDEFRNTPASLGAYAKKIQVALGQLKEEFPDNKRIERVLEHATNIVEITAGFSKKSDDFLSAIKLKLSDLDIQEHDLQGFIKAVVDEFIKEKSSQQQEICADLDFTKLAKTREARFDCEKMKHCLQVIMDNAVKFKAKNILFKVFSKHGNTGKASVVMTISNDGFPMDQRVGDQLLQYFSSTDRRTGSGGLAIVKAIVQAHGGKIELKLQPRTQFIIQLPMT